MADITEEVTYRQEISVVAATKKKQIVFRALNVDDGDTITIGDVTTINSAHVCDESDGSEVTVDLATNVITINDVGVSGDNLRGYIIGW